MDQEKHSMSADEESLNLRQYWHIVLERKWLALAAFLLVIVLTGVYLVNTTSIFSAFTRLQIDRETDNALRMESFSMDSYGETDYLQTQYKDQSYLSNLIDQGIVDNSNLN